MLSACGSNDVAIWCGKNALCAGCADVDAQKHLYFASERAVSFCVHGLASTRDERDLDGPGAVRDESQPLLELRKGQLVAADTVQWQATRLDHPDGRGPAVRSQVGTADVEFLVITDDAPVDCDVGAEDAVLHECPEFAQDVQPLEYCGRVAGSLKVDVGAVAVAQIADYLTDVVAGDVERYIGAARPGEFKLVG